MKTYLSDFIETSRSAVRYWWLFPILGLALFVMGIVVFFYPAESYLSLAIFFGALMLFAGIFEVVLSIGNRDFITGRGWMLAGGMLQVLLGMILMFNPVFSATTLPLFLGFWLLFRGFLTVGWGGDMSALHLPGVGWTVTSGILLILLALMVLLQPLTFGTRMVVAWMGVSLLFAGMTAILFGFQLRSVHRHIK